MSANIHHYIFPGSGNGTEPRSRAYCKLVQEKVGTEKCGTAETVGASKRQGARVVGVFLREEAAGTSRQARLPAGQTSAQRGGRPRPLPDTAEHRAIHSIA